MASTINNTVDSNREATSTSPYSALSIAPTQRILQRQRFLETRYATLGDSWQDREQIRNYLVIEDSSASLPTLRFALTKQLVDAVAAAQEREGRLLMTSELIDLAHSCRKGAIGEFSSDALNRLNSAYYSAHTTEAALPDDSTIAVTHLPYAKALLRFLQNSSQKPTIKVKELSCGNHPDRWRVWAEESHALSNKEVNIPKIRLELSDFSTPTETILNEIPETPLLTPTLTDDNFFEPLKRLPKAQRHDAILAAYAFDCMWLPEDAQYEKAGDQWYQLKYRLKTSDLHPRPAALRQWLETGEKPKRVTLEDLRSIQIEISAELVSLSDLPHGEILIEETEGDDSAVINYPGGLLSVVDQAFRKQIAPGGCFIITDTGGSYSFDRGDELPYYDCGIVSLYRSVDFLVAERALNELGYDAEIQTFKEFIQNNLGRNWRRDASQEEREICEWEDQNVMIIQRIGE